MTPGKYNLAIYRGDSYHWRFTLWEDIDRTDPVDLTGVTAKAEIRAASGGVVYTEIQCTVIQPNIIDGILSATASKLIPKTGVWDLQLTYGTGDVKTPLAGAVTITPDVTDSGGVARVI